MIEWITSPGLTPYEDALAAMDARVDAVLVGGPEAVWLLEHPPLYTAGTSARPEDLRDPGRLPVHHARRGGQHTYHGPGQRVAYLMLDLSRRGRDVRRYVRDVEGWVTGALASFALRAETRAGRVGVWVSRPEKPPLPGGEPREDKIAAIGVRVRRWVAFHGVAINVEPDLAHYDGIVPCGVTGHGVTSLMDLGLPVTMADLDAALLAAFEPAFGEAAVPAPGPLAPAPSPGCAPWPQPVAPARAGG